LASKVIPTKSGDSKSVNAVQKIILKRGITPNRVEIKEV